MTEILAGAASEPPLAAAVVSAKALHSASELVPEGPRPESVILRVHLLAGFRVAAGPVELPAAVWRSQKAAHLVQLLALAPDHVLHREQLCDLLWPAVVPATAATNLRQTVHIARRVLLGLPLEPEQLLHRQGGCVRLYPAACVWTDVAALEAAARAARPAADPARYWAAVDRYPGPLLPDQPYEDWAASRRESLAAIYLALLDDVAQLHEVRGEYPQALAALRRLVAAEPAHEDATVRLMHLYAITGRRSLALRQYNRLVQTLARELDMAPEPATVALAQAIKRGTFPPVPPRDGSGISPAAVPPTPPPLTNLPQPLTKFIGRQQEVTELVGALAGHRLVTLTGPGGIGKTRLALEVARRRLAAYRDGVWLVELAALTDPTFLPQAIADGLGIPTDGRGGPLDLLVRELGERELLLVLDNCEHLVDACADVVDKLLAACPAVRVLATSREALRLPGERRWSVPALPLPVPDAVLATLMANEAVALFSDRVRWHQPDFMLTPETADFVTAICRRLEGVPLALELAAAQTSLLTLPQLAARLDDALSVLTGGSRSVPTRQQTLRATLDWSHGLLKYPQQVLFRRLAVFRGGWTLEAGEAICPGGEIAAHDLLGLLGQLVETSLVQVERIDGAAWYRLLEPVRQYATELLQASGEAEEVRARHAAYFVSYVEELEPALMGSGQAVLFARLDREHDNLRGALGWALACHDAATVLRLGSVLWRYWRLRWHSAEGLAWLEAALALPTATRSALLARAAGGAGELARRLQHFDRARTLLEEALSISHDVGDAAGAAWALVMLAGILSQLGDVPGARARAQEGLERFRELDDQAGIALALNLLAEDARMTGDHARAGDLYRESLARYRLTGDQLSMALQLHNLGYVALTGSDVPGAVRSFRESHLLSQAIGNRGGPLSFLEGMAAAASAASRHLDAVRLYGAFTAACAPPGAEFKLHPADQVEYDRYLGQARAALGKAAFARSWAKGTATPLEQAIIEALALADAIAGGQPSASLLGMLPLTAREEEIARLVAEQLTNHQIARRLGLSERTVDTHVSHILRKLHLSTRGQIASQFATPAST